MLSVAEAESAIAGAMPLLPTEDCALLQARGRILRGSIAADRDMPPFDRVTMDGFALSSAALAAGECSFRVAGLQAAGMMPQKLEDAHTCIEVATGAMLPTGTDCVVPYEEVVRDGSMIQVQHAQAFNAGTHVHQRGSDHRMGNVLVRPGTRLTPRELAVAASVGAGVLRVSVIPRIAVVSTGDELVDVEAPAPAAHQIRRSNDLALSSALQAAGFPRVERFHFRDVRSEIFDGLRRLMTEADVLILTGGVSKGKYDYLPSVLEELNVRKIFQGVAQRPGKPLWFGVSPRQTPIFALPGNPVSTYVCFRRFVLPALAQMSGAPTAKRQHAVLTETVRFQPPLTYFIPVRLEHDEAGACRAQPMPTNTSGDFSALVGTDGFLELPASVSEFPPGTAAPFWRWDL